MRKITADRLGRPAPPAVGVGLTEVDAELPLRLTLGLSKLMGSVDTMTGATDISDGLRGTPPKPVAGDDDAVLFGSGEWKHIDDDSLPDELDANARVAVLKNDVLVGKRRAINFIEGDAITIVANDDGPNEEIEVTISASSTTAPPALTDPATPPDLTSNARLEVRKNSVSVGKRRAINLIEGANVTLTVTDDDPDEEVEIEIAATGNISGNLTVPYLPRASGADTLEDSRVLDDGTTIQALGNTWIGASSPVTAPVSRLTVHESNPTPSAGGSVALRVGSGASPEPVGPGSGAVAGAVVVGSNLASQDSGALGLVAVASQVHFFQITDASNNSPIVITAPAHGVSNGETVKIAGVTGNPGANGTWVVTYIDENSFSLDGSTGNGTFSGGDIKAEISAAVHVPATGRPLFGVRAIVAPYSTDVSGDDYPFYDTSDVVDGFIAEMYPGGAGGGTSAFVSRGGGATYNGWWNNGITLSRVKQNGIVFRRVPRLPLTITDASNETPIVIEAVAHGGTTGQRAWIAGVSGNTAANGQWAAITVIDENHFSLDTSVGNGAFSAWDSSESYLEDPGEPFSSVIFDMSTLVAGGNTTLVAVPSQYATSVDDATSDPVSSLWITGSNGIAPVGVNLVLDGYAANDNGGNTPNTAGLSFAFQGSVQILYRLSAAASHELVLTNDGDVFVRYDSSNGNMAFFGADPVTQQSTYGPGGTDDQRLTALENGLIALGLFVAGGGGGGA